MAHKSESARGLRFLAEQRLVYGKVRAATGRKAGDAKEGQEKLEVLLQVTRKQPPATEPRHCLPTKRSEQMGNLKQGTREEQGIRHGAFPWH